MFLEVIVKGLNKNKLAVVINTFMLTCPLNQFIKQKEKQRQELNPLSTSANVF